MAIFNRVVPVLIASAITLSAVSVPAQATIRGWDGWTRGGSSTPPSSTACEDLVETASIRIDALEAIRDDLKAQLQDPGLSRRDKIQIKIDLRKISTRIAIIKRIEHRASKRYVNDRICERLEAKVIKIASFPY